MIARALVLGTTLALVGCGVRTALDVAPDGSVMPRDGGAGLDAATVTCRTDGQCDDRRECNGVELCIGGRCAPGEPPRCDDSTECTHDQCVEGMGCVSVPDDSVCPRLMACDPTFGCSPIRCTSDEECQDGVACNGFEGCAPSGLCTLSSPPSCDDGVECTVERCAEPDGACESIPDDTLCGAGRTCDPARGCVAARCGSDADCDDRLFCTGQERCGPGGTCVAGTPIACADGAACTDDVCDEGARACVSRPSTRCPAGEICSPVPGDADGCRVVPCMGDAQCRDASVCNGEERCVAARCVRGAPLDCGPVAECQVATCSDAEGGCVVVPRAEREICTNGLDDDCDEQRDCEDEPDCRAHPACACRPSSRSEVRCGDGVDDDCDERIDCDDPDCAPAPACARGELFCADLRDDDGDGLVDCADPDCARDPRCGARDAGPPPLDAGAPRDAGRPRDAGPVANELGIAACTNGVDDDRDGRTDCSDRDCRPFLPDGECCNGIDDEPGDDTPADVFTCRCFDDSTCAGVSEFDQVCWRSAFSVCAPRCNFFGGDAWCRSLMVGLPRCNVSTGECVP